MRRLFRIGPVLRISMGIMSLVISLVLVFDVFFDLLPSRQMLQVQARSLSSRLIAEEIGALLTRGDLQGVQAAIDRIVADGSEIQSIGVRQADATLIAASRDHARRQPAAGAHAAVPLVSDGMRWGDVELVYADRTPLTIAEWMMQPNILFLAALGTLGFGAVYLYLRRALQHLDPGASVPQRVRGAFDTLTEAVALINRKGQIMLANDVFLKMTGAGEDLLEGKPVEQINWLVTGLADDVVEYPWQQVLRSGYTVQGLQLKVTLPDGRTHELIMNCSAINDGTGGVRGCLLTFDDVTPLSEANAALQSALQDLRISRDKIQKQNEELEKHAHYDHLTGCLNRRAFFAQAEAAWRNAVASGGQVFCIMCDIDHFKTFNDRFGHAVGDAVIQSVAATMRRALRNGDLFCRYGGEEFCILLADTDFETGMTIADRIRTRVLAEAGPGVRAVSGLRITSSVGFSALHKGDARLGLNEMIEEADQGLYVAKKAGRNRVAQADGTVIAGEDPPPQRVEEPAAVA